MQQLLAGIVGGLVGRLAAKFAGSSVGDQPSFASVLAERMSEAETADLEPIAAPLMDLPITSAEARQIASRLKAIVESLRSASSIAGFGAKAKKVLADFVSDVSNEYALSQAEVARLKKAVDDYAGKELFQRLPV